MRYILPKGTEISIDILEKILSDTTATGNIVEFCSGVLKLA